MNILELLNKEKTVNKFESLISNEKFSMYVVSPINQGYLLAYKEFKEKNRTIVYVSPNTYKATQAYEAFNQLAGSDSVSFYAVDELNTTELVAVSNDFRFERINTLKKISQGIPQIIVTHIQAVLRPLMNFEYFKKSLIKLETSKDIDIASIIKSLIMMGYKKVPTCDMVGEFSVRGEVIDIFPVFSSNPIRIDLFDTEIDSIRYYDSQTQKSIRKIDEVDIYPVSDLIYDDSNIERAIKRIEHFKLTDKINNDIKELENRESPEKINKYIDYLYESHCVFFDYLEEKTVYYEEFNSIKEKYEAMCLDIEDLNDSDIELKYFVDLYEITSQSRQIFLSEYLKSLNGISLDTILNLYGYRVNNYAMDLKTLFEDVRISSKKHFIVLETKDKAELIKNILLDNNISFGEETFEHKVNIHIIDNAISFAFDDICVLTEKELFPKYSFKKTKFDVSKYNTVTINSKDDIKPGDFVVHYEYGICKYNGLRTETLSNTTNDYLSLTFSDGDLYVPVDRITFLEKYVGSEGSVPKLSKIKGDEWKKKKEKVKAKVENIARRLIETQAKRASKLGYKYECDQELMDEFEKDFEFDETVDQLEAINAIKKDMEEGKIIDRLICGDVGYGKTEIAARAAFRTVLCDKQVAYLAPTTILTRQHYYTFKDRFEKYGVRVAMLNRLVAPQEQKRILKGLKDKTIDIVIGTHRMLSEDVRFKDLGLLIIDEEQRFGVKHKEKIKELKSDVNVLTLTATPIPRTLQMSMMGLREFSLINTPPKDRFPIQTYVLEYNNGIVKEAIYKELGRGGQVFYLHNNVSTIASVASKINKMVPEARVCFAHGQMQKEEIEDIIQAFIDKEFDVLVCTTIIETGIDIPNSNTLIIDRADKLGLSQLYQIRGRIGRSDKIAYAYLMYDKGKVLTESGAKRLNAIKEFTNLGSGYKIALRDLAIRGAGDILGSEQSGFIDMIGMDLYMKMLQDSIDEIKGLPKAKEDKKYAIEISKHVSDNYVNDEEIKILIHEKINALVTKEDKFNLIDELNDRFGKLKYDVLLYIEERYLERLLNKFEIEGVGEDDLYVKIEFPEKISNGLDGSKVLIQANRISKNFYFEYRDKKLKVKYKKQTNDKRWIFVMTRFLEGI